MRILLCSLILLVFGYAGITLGQEYWQNTWGNPNVWGMSNHHSSTVEEGVQRGFADVVRSAGAYNLMTSEAMGNVEDARKKYIDNRTYGAEKYFEMRDLNRRARAAERGSRPTMEDAIRYANSRKPSRLSPSELDPLSGDITWPEALRQQQYKEHRDQLEKIYAQRSEAGFLSADQLAQADSLTKSMMAQLKDNLRSYSPQAYTQAKSFLESLAYESRLQPS
jgi:hypothetical protein